MSDIPKTLTIVCTGVVHNKDREQVVQKSTFEFDPPKNYNENEEYLNALMKSFDALKRTPVQVGIQYDVSFGGDVLVATCIAVD